ncbi:MAG: tetratricopeptide repeat protein [Gemmatimonadetes bacterium]|nr:tetratricopeptide repeat protein [Gemmatimonadota bacterium]
MPDFTAHVAPILAEHCLECHRTDGPAPFPLDTWEHAHDLAARIAAVAGERRMPPWLPGPADVALADARTLSDREIAILQRWADTGAQPGDAGESSDLSIRVAGGQESWTLGEPDLVLELEPPFMLPPGSADAATHQATPTDAAATRPPPDVFRNFVLSVPVDRVRWVRAVEFQPTDARVVHHLVMAVDTTRASREEDARDADPGFEGMFARSGARSPGGFLVGWTPGKTPRANPEGFAWPLVPGSDLVLQMHLRPLAGPVHAGMRIGLWFADREPERTPLLIRLGGQTLDIPAGEAGYAVTDSVRLPVEVELFGVYPHAHYLGRTMRAWAVLPNGEERVLLRIDDWDFNWQDAYAFERPVRLPAGTVLRMRYTYDNSAGNPRNPNRPPARVVYGPGSTDEMAELWLQAAPRATAGLAALQEELARKSVRDRVEGWQHLVRLNPADASAHANLGAFHQSQRNLDSAAYHYRQAVAAEPDYAAAHYNLGIVLEARGEQDAAERHYREALRTRPDHAATHNNLGNVLLAQGKLDEAAQHFERALALAPDQPEPHANHGRLLWQQGRTAEAMQSFRRAVDVQPDAPAARFNLALALATIGSHGEALAQLDTASRLAPHVIEPRLAVAWIWATHADSAVRRPADAVRLAEQAAAAVGRPDPHVMDVLAAAHAAAGNFAIAVRLARDAVRLASAAGEDEVAARIAERLAQYESGRPWVAGR